MLDAVIEFLKQPRSIFEGVLVVAVAYVYYKYVHGERMASAETAIATKNEVIDSLAKHKELLKEDNARQREELTQTRNNLQAAYLHIVEKSEEQDLLLGNVRRLHRVTIALRLLITYLKMSDSYTSRLALALAQEKLGRFFEIKHPGLSLDFVDEARRKLDIMDELTTREYRKLSFDVDPDKAIPFIRIEVAELAHAYEDYDTNVQARVNESFATTARQLDVVFKAAAEALYPGLPPDEGLAKLQAGADETKQSSENRWAARLITRPK